MRTLTKTILLTAAAFTATAQAAWTAPAGIDAEVDAEVDAQQYPGDLSSAIETLVPVDSIPAFGRLHSWNVVTDDTLIIWATPFRPYLVRLFRPSPELKFAVGIGVTSFGSRIHARFDSVEIAGFSYPIREIYQLSRDEADELKARS